MLFKRNRATRYTHRVLKEYFPNAAPEEIVTAVRTFPARMRADLQVALDGLFDGPVPAMGLRQKHRYETLTFAELWEEGHQAVLVAPLQRIEVDVGEEQPVACLQNALWLLEEGGLRHAVLLSQHQEYGQETGLHVEVAVPAGAAGAALTERYFKALETAIAAAGSYRGKVLSLEADRNYSGKSTGIQVHRLNGVARDQLVLPLKTLELLERNVFEFFAQRARLAELRMSVKKGLLFYGPPGTGKTHTIHYLASRLEGHTTLLVTAEQIGLLGEYMALARLLQPAIVVIEDADLIARNRIEMGSACEEVLLNRLLNEMDGLREDAEILFILTTNRPESLEAALASRPGRIDQAIEFPLPDETGRRKLARLYARGLEVPEPVLQAVVRRSDRTSAAFIKELMRRAAQFCLARGGGARLELADVDGALDELLVSGGSLNATLLGGAEASLHAASGEPVH